MIYSYDYDFDFVSNWVDNTTTAIKDAIKLLPLSNCFVGKSEKEIKDLITETEAMGIIDLCALMEKYLRQDLNKRIESNMSDSLSRYIKQKHNDIISNNSGVKKTKLSVCFQNYVLGIFKQKTKCTSYKCSLEQDIIEQCWQEYPCITPKTKQLFSDLKGILKDRHWLAHGRYWTFTPSYKYNNVLLVCKDLLDDLTTNYNLTI